MCTALPLPTSLSLFFFIFQIDDIAEIAFFQNTCKIRFVINSQLSSQAKPNQIKLLQLTRLLHFKL